MRGGFIRFSETMTGRPDGGNSSLVATTSAKIEDTYQVNARVTYGFGRPRDAVPSSPAGGPWALGAHLLYSASTNVLDLGLRHRGGIGAFVSYRFSRFLEADGAVSMFPQRTRARSSLPLLDIGGVVEIAAASGLLFRVDAGASRGLCSIRLNPER